MKVYSDKVAECSVSVALCTYNGANWIADQLRSLDEQTRRPDEIVVCDDGSSDDTLTCIEDFAASSSIPVRVFRNEKRLGFTKNFELALSKTRGQIIFLCDQDDWWLSRKIEIYLEHFADPEVTLVSSNSLLVDEDLRSMGTTLWQRYRISQKHVDALNGTSHPIVQVVKQYALLGHTLAFRRSVADLMPPIPIAGHDYWAVLCGCCLGEIRLIPDCLTQYRIHSRQQSKGVIGENLLTDVSKRTPSEHFSGKASAFLKLADRLEDLNLHDDPSRARIEKSEVVLRDKAGYMNKRGDLRKNRTAVRRAIDVAMMLASGQYHRYGRGLLSAAKDLIG